MAYSRLRRLADRASIIGKDPVRHRPLMLAGVVEKVTFFVAAWWLFAKGRIEATIVGFASFEMVIGARVVDQDLRRREEGVSVALESPRVG
ncbi:MAG: hypothetical protein U0744_17370 [Gemmataceae bacterium]